MCCSKAKQGPWEKAGEYTNSVDAFAAASRQFNPRLHGKQPAMHPQRKGDGEGSKVSTYNPTPSTQSRSSSSSMNLPFWVSFVEQTRVEIWKESLLMVQLPRFCMLFPVAECPFSSSSILVDGRLKYVEASSSFFASAYRGVLNTAGNNLKISRKKT